MSKANQSYSQYLGSVTNAPPLLGGGNIMVARVAHVVQGPFYAGTTIPDPYYTDPTSLGSIAYTLISSPQDRTLESAGNPIAKPLFFGFKQYPLEGELVYLLVGPSVDMNENRGSREYFYLPPYNLWGASHHNAFPDMGDYQEYVSIVGRTYENSLANKQAVNLSASGSLTFPLGPNFPEKSNIRSLRQFTGDVTLEGRWGNSIRLGSTTFSNDPAIRENNWSQDSEFGNPITIIRNGQGTPTNNVPWFPTVENINKDPSSIYLTQGQKIVIDDIQNNFSLASLNINFEATQTIAIPIQQQLTSTETTSAIEQDRFTQEITDPTPTVPLITPNIPSSGAIPGTINLSAVTAPILRQPTVLRSALITPNIPSAGAIPGTINLSAATAPTLGQPNVPTVVRTPTQPALRVVGDYQDLSFIDGTYVVSLRAVNPDGTIINTASATGTTAQAAYQSAVTSIKAKNTGRQLNIPGLNSLIN